MYKPPSLPDIQEGMQLYDVSGNLENQTVVALLLLFLKARLHL